VLALVGLQARPRVLVELWLLTLAAGAILVQRMPGLNASSDLAEMTMLSAIVLFAAGAFRERGQAQRRLAEQQHISDTERARRAQLEERTRIARELHDVVAHHMSVIAIQAEAAPYRPPEETAKSFATIRATATEGLRELRRVVGVLRAEGSTEDPDPQPTLDRLDDLVASARGTGLRVTAAVTGTPRPLAPGVELSAYRILQEALSNAMRHAPGSDVRVEIAYRPAWLELRIVNGPARTPPLRSPGAGHGVLGMRERAAMLGGELTAASRPDGGYAVAAVLPATRDNGA
jgi:signal transduction histidine kinase